MQFSPDQNHTVHSVALLTWRFLIVQDLYSHISSNAGVFTYLYRCILHVHSCGFVVFFLIPEDDKRQEKGSKVPFQPAIWCKVCTFAFQNSHQWDRNSAIPNKYGEQHPKTRVLIPEQPLLQRLSTEVRAWFRGEGFAAIPKMGPGAHLGWLVGERCCLWHGRAPWVAVNYNKMVLILAFYPQK